MKPRRQRYSVDSDWIELSESEFQAEDLRMISKPHSGHTASRHNGRKSRQLCHQIATTLNSVLSGECGDPILQALFVQSVCHSGDFSQVLVLVEVTDPLLQATHAEILTKLQARSGWLRAQVATSITRRRTPQLSFQIRFPVG